MASVKKTAGGFLDVLKHLLEILTWKETWILSGVACLIAGFWFVFALALFLPNPWRAIIIWGEILSLAVLVRRERPK